MCCVPLSVKIKPYVVPSSTHRSYVLFDFSSLLLPLYLTYPQLFGFVIIESGVFSV